MDTTGSEEVLPGVHRLGSHLVNWYAIEDGGRLTIVDCGLPGFAGDLEAALASFGHTPADVEAVVLTHSDGDHTGLAPRLQEAGASVHIHADDAATLRKPGPKTGDGAPVHLLPLLWRPAFWRFFGGMMRSGGAKPQPVLGAQTFSGGDVLDVPGKPQVIHTPGHTPGHCSLHFAGHATLVAGDALCTWNPLTGTRRPQLMPKPFNTDYAQCHESLAALEGVVADVVLCGHGEPWRDSPAAAVAAARRGD